jgi:uncharacterized protein (DUF433 family)
MTGSIIPWRPLEAHYHSRLDVWEQTEFSTASTGDAAQLNAGYPEDVKILQRITIDPDVMGGKPCIRGMRVTVGMIVESMAAGRTVEQLLSDFPYLEEADIREALAFAV